MGKLIYAVNTSLDGFIEDEAGNFDWSTPDEGVHLFYNDLVRGVGLHLLGRRTYETMAVWETDASLAQRSGILAEFAAAWQDSDKLVYTTSLASPLTRRTQLRAAFDPDEVAALKRSHRGDLLVGGPNLAAQALNTGLVDQILLVVSPVVLGAGKPALPPGLRLDLELADQRCFDSGAVHVAYRVRS